MKSRALDSNNDLIVQRGQLAIVQDGAEVVQHVRTRLLFYRGEWFLDVFAGVPWFQEGFIKPANLANVESFIKTTILRTPEVQSLTNFSMVYNSTTRKIVISCGVETTYGKIELNEVLVNV